MPKFDMGAAWDDAMALVRAHLPLTSVLAGIFLFLPSMAGALLGPAPVVPPADVSPDAASALLAQYFKQLMPWLFVSILASTMGTIAILRLWLARSGTSVGEALLFAVLMLPTAVILTLIMLPIYAIAALALLVPALYLMGRLAVVYPYLTDRDTKNPIAALAGSWELTKGNGWRITLFILLILIAIFVIVMIVGGVTSLFGPYGSAGYVVGRIINSVLAACLGLVNTAVLAATYRQLATRGSGALFE